MKISPFTWFSSLGAGAVGATVAVLMLGGGHSAPQQPTYVLHQDAQTGAAVITSSAPAATAKPVAPKLAAPTSTVVVKQPAAVQEAPVVTDTSTDTGSAPSVASSAPAFEPIRSHPGNGAPSSTSAISVTTPPDGGSSH